MTSAVVRTTSTDSRFTRPRWRAALTTRLVLAAILLTVVQALAQAQTVTATWDANTDPYTAGYRLYYGTAPGVYTTNLDVGNVSAVR